MTRKRKKKWPLEEAYPIVIRDEVSEVILPMAPTRHIFSSGGSWPEWNPPEDPFPPEDKRVDYIRLRHANDDLEASSTGEHHPDGG